MKKWNTYLLITVMTVMLAIISVLTVKAQIRKMRDKAIVGTWVMVSMQFDGESKKIVCGKEYSQVKYYGPKGEYACAEIVKNKNTYLIIPHEYGTYTYNNGKYTEMGRKGTFVIKGNTASGRWYNRYDIWKKAPLPEALRKEVVFRCKAHATPSAKIQNMIHRYVLNKK